LLRALRSKSDVVLLIDEVDKVDFEFEALLLEILSDFQVTIPELGTVKGTRHPFVVLTSNNTRELSEALKRRALYLYLDYPSVEREKEIVLSRVPEAPEHLADQLVRIVRSLRQLELKKPPSISETLDWARTLLELGFDTIDEEVAKGTMNVLLKYQQDVQKATGHLRLPPRPEMN
jgi:MoxR-like ATPase